ncbi:MAG: hypothetical protein VKS61_07995 [Candidatus Sericytochromatia bacterium]|nr:hypothetical protein [Candidatus Sericytochromatia bacterium]
MTAGRSGLALGLALTVLGAPPAEAALGDTYLRFEKSLLLQGDRLFRYEGRQGARFRFGPARGCTIGNPLLLVDVQDGLIVQQVLVLPLPRRERDMPRLEHVVGLFLQDAGLDAEARRVAARTFTETCRSGKGTRKPLGPEARWMLDTVASPALGQVVLAVGFRPTALAPGSQQERGS